MLLGAGTFQAQVDLLRTVSITGGKGTGKDLLAAELAQYYLDQGYKYSTNQECVWNDPMFTISRLTDEEWSARIADFQVDAKGVFTMVEQDTSFIRLVFGDDTKVYKRHSYTPLELSEFVALHGRDELGYFERIPDMRRRVLVVSEGGRYLRTWKYFENMYEFSRKTDNYIFIPSIRLPHVDLCEIICINVFPFKYVTGKPGGVFYWYVPGSGHTKAVGGVFLHIPGKVGIYDTKDLSTSPTAVIDWFGRQIDYIQSREYGRSDGIRAMESASTVNEQDSLATYARQIQQSALSLQGKNK